MPRTIEIDTRHPSYAAACKRRMRLTTATYVNGLFTVAAGRLNDLAPNDMVSIGGGPHFLCGPRWNLGATTFTVSETPNGPPAPCAGSGSLTVSTGLLTQADDGVLGGNYISADFPLAR